MLSYLGWCSYLDTERNCLWIKMLLITFDVYLPVTDLESETLNPFCKVLERSDIDWILVLPEKGLK